MISLSCPLASKHIPWYMCPHMHMHIDINICNFKIRWGAIEGDVDLWPPHAHTNTHTPHKHHHQQQQPEGIFTLSL